MITVKDLIAYRMAREQLVERVATAKLPTKYGEFTVHGYKARFGNTEAEHIALTMGDIADGEPVLVRVHSECLTGDVLGSQRCDCGEQLRRRARDASRDEGRGVFLYLRQEGRGIGLMNKMRGVRPAGPGPRHRRGERALGFKADHREYGIGMPDPDGPRRAARADPHEQPEEGRRARCTASRSSSGSRSRSRRTRRTARISRPSATRWVICSAWSRRRPARALSRRRVFHQLVARRGAADRPSRPRDRGRPS